MKKITWLFMSLMLFLGLGAAFAQPSAPVLISPANNATVEPGQPLSFVKNEDYAGMTTCLFYTFDDNASFEDVITMDRIDAVMGAMSSGGDVDGIYGTMLAAASIGSVSVFADDPDLPTTEIAAWMPTPTIPSNASGTVTLRVCACNVTQEGFSALSPITTATYTVGEATLVPAPTLPASGAVPMNSVITISKPVTEDDGFYYSVLYVLNDENFNFSQYTYYADDYGVCECTPVPDNMIPSPSAPIVITETTTVTVITVRYNGYTGKIEGWSEKVTATYTVQTPPAAPTFLPDGGEVEADEDITITTTTEGAKVYYSTTATFVNIATETALEEAENKDEVKAYSATAKPTLEDLNVDPEMASNPSISA
ncbi:MAG: hypothetical protein K2O37_01635, partial [Bacteroidales bacterium]|nr:hypothetical protein [Bacteroidales bacterium]